MKRNNPDSKNRLNHFLAVVLKFTILSGIIFLAFSWSFSYIWGSLEKSDYFKITEVLVRQASGLSARRKIDFSYLKEKSILSIDIKKEAGYILGACPECSSVRVVRILPNRLFIDFVKRKPVALVKLYRYFALDKEGVLFYVPAKAPDLELPVITGLETKVFGPKPGRKYNLKEIDFSLNVIDGIKNNQVFSGYKIKKIDVANRAGAILLVPMPENNPAALGFAAAKQEGIEVRFGEDKLKEKIALLASVFAQGRSDLSNIKYIDLRFKEPVVKFKDAKPKT